MPDVPEVCPQCGSTRLAKPVHDPCWCVDCEWNLEAFPPPQRRKATRFDRISHRIAFRLNRRLAKELESSPPERAPRTSARYFLLTVSFLLLAATVALVGGGLVLLFGNQFGLRIVGFFMVLIGIEIRPRWPRWKIETGFVTRAEAPALYALVDQIADGIGAPHITTIAVDEWWNASCGLRGLRREPTLVIGLPLWAALGPSGRLALLGHELGHLVNGDPTRGLLTQQAFETFDRIASLFNPRRISGTLSGQGAFFATMGNAVGAVLFTPIWWLARWLQIGVWSVALRDHQRAEIYADTIGFRLAGSDGAAELTDALMFRERLHTAVARSAREGDPVAKWREKAEAARLEAQPRRRAQQQSSMRCDASLFASHPPSGLRARLVTGWPRAVGSDLVDPARWEAIDAALAPQYARVRRALSSR